MSRVALAFRRSFVSTAHRHQSSSANAATAQTATNVSDRQQQRFRVRRTDVNEVHVRGRIAGDASLFDFANERKLGLFTVAINAADNPYRRTSFVNVTVPTRFSNLFTSGTIARGVEVEIRGKLFNSRKSDGSMRQEVFAEELEVKKEANKPFSGSDE